MLLRIRRHAGIEPARRAGVQSVAQKKIIRNPETARQCLTAAAIKS
jgi:hypothetical protein